MLALFLASAAWLTHLAPSFTATTSTPARSDELKRERLPADVDFVVHIDLEGFKQTELWKHISEKSGGLEAEIDELHEIRTRFGIDPLTDVRAVTLFKTQGEEDP